MEKKYNNPYKEDESIDELMSNLYADNGIEQRSYSDTLYKQDEQQAIQQENLERQPAKPTTLWEDVKSFGSGVVDVPIGAVSTLSFEDIPLIGGFVKGNNDEYIRNIHTFLEKDMPITEDERNDYENYFKEMEESKNTSIGFEIGRGLKDSGIAMLEMWAGSKLLSMAGVLSKSQKVIEISKMTNSLSKVGFGTKSSKFLANTLSAGKSIGIKTATDIAIQAPAEIYKQFSAQKLQKVFGNDNEQQKNAIVMALSNVGIEAFTERMGGGLIGAFGKRVNKFIPQEYKDKILSLAVIRYGASLLEKPTAKSIKNLTTAVSYHGLVEEFEEERIGDFLRGMIQEGKGFKESLISAFDKTKREWLIEAGVLIVPGLGFGVANKVINSKKESNNPIQEQEVEQQEQQDNEVFPDMNPEVQQLLVDNIDNGVPPTATVLNDEQGNLIPSFVWNTEHGSMMYMKGMEKPMPLNGEVLQEMMNQGLFSRSQNGYEEIKEEIRFDEEFQDEDGQWGSEVTENSINAGITQWFAKLQDMGASDKVLMKLQDEIMNFDDGVLERMVADGSIVDYMADSENKIKSLMNKEEKAVIKKKVLALPMPVQETIKAVTAFEKLSVAKVQEIVDFAETAGMPVEAIQEKILAETEFTKEDVKEHAKLVKEVESQEVESRKVESRKVESQEVGSRKVESRKVESQEVGSRKVESRKVGKSKDVISAKKKEATNSEKQTESSDASKTKRFASEARPEIGASQIADNRSESLTDNSDSFTSSDELRSTQNSIKDNTTKNKKSNEKQEKSEKKEVYGSKNKIITTEQHEKNKEEFRKMLSRMSSGIDPAFAVLGAKMATYHIESGVRKFAEFAKIMRDDFPENFDKFKGNLIGFWQHGTLDFADDSDIEDLTRKQANAILEEINNNKGENDDNNEHTKTDRVLQSDDTNAELSTNETRLDDRNATNENNGDLSDKGNQGNTGNSLADGKTGNENQKGVQGDTVIRTGDNQSGNIDESGNGSDRKTNGRNSESGDRGLDNGLDNGGGKSSDLRHGGRVSKPAKEKNIGRNYVINDNTVLVPKGDIAKTQSNIEAIELIKILDSEKRGATPKEQDVLSKYVGWGGLANIFKEPVNAKFAEYQTRLKILLTKDEYKSAKSSVLDSFYTDRKIIKQAWNIAERLGFDGGTILENSAGVGHFLGLMPQTITKKSNVTAIELDTLTAKIAGYLYPEHTVKNDGFQNVNIPEQKVDLVIGNFPFGQTKLFDEKYNPNRKEMIHNYFFLKSMALLREGGLMIAITSTGTMETATNAKKLLSENMELVGSIRLPSNAFKDNAGTEVVSDMIILRKVKEKDIINPFIKRVTIKQDGVDYKVNEYYRDNPEMMLGRLEMDTGLGGRVVQSLVMDKDKDISTEIDKVMDNLPKDIYESSVSEKVLETLVIDMSVKNGSFVEKNGELYHNENGTLMPAKIYRKNGNASDFSKGKTGSKQKLAIKGAIELRDELKSLLNDQVDKNVNEKIFEKKRRDFVKKYNSFVKKFGRFNEKFVKGLFQFDPEYFLLASLEKKDELGDESKKETYTNTGILVKRVGFPPTDMVATAESFDDALDIVYSYKGMIDVPAISRIMNNTISATRDILIEKGLVFENPSDRKLVMRSEYLSGNVKQKLKEASSKNENHIYDENIFQLEMVIPKDVEIDNIGVSLSSRFVDINIIKEWIKERFDTNVSIQYDIGRDEYKVDYIGYSSEVSQQAVNWDEQGISGSYGVDKMLSNLLNNRGASIVVRRQDVTYRIKTGSLSASVKQKEFNKQFSEWLPNSRYADKVAKEYNDVFNANVQSEYDGKLKQFVNSNPEIKLRDYQIKVVNRAIRENTLIAHAVGSGKTFSAITIAMEKKRLGLSRKPMIVVQNSTIEQFAESFKVLYPNAMILHPTKDDFASKATRKLFLAKIATLDFDSVIIPQSFFDRIKNSVEMETEFAEKQLREFQQILDDIDRSSPDNKQSVKSIEAQIKNLNERLASILSEADNSDDLLDFSQLGVDSLIIDEAHEYKKIPFVTKMQQVKGLDKGSSKKAINLLLKTEYIRNNSQNNNLVFMTGTPITNTVQEAWSMLKLLSPDVLKEYGVENFDRFASAFTFADTTAEYTAMGNLKMVERFASYINKPELVTMWRKVADIVTPDDIGYIKPDMVGGKPNAMLIESSETMRNVVQYFRERFKIWGELTGEEKKEASAEPLVITGLAKRSTLDLRLLSSNMPDEPSSKLNKSVEVMIDMYNKHEEHKASQIIFSDNFNSKDGKFNAFQEIKRKLIEKGIPANEIEIISDQKGAKLSKIFDKVNSGEVRFVMGSTARLGVGVNVQQRLVALHNLDAPWRPMDLEQREGRALRAGNIFKDLGGVNIFRYGVENTMDSALYQILAKKQRFITDLMNNSTNREMVDELSDDVALSMEEAMAAFSGDDNLKRKLELEQEVDLLSAQEQTFNVDKELAIDNKARAERIIVKRKKLISDYLADYNNLVDNIDKDVHNVKIGNKQYPSTEEGFVEANKKLNKLIATARKEQVNTVSSYARKETYPLTDINYNGIDYKLQTEVSKRADGTNQVQIVAYVQNDLHSKIIELSGASDLFKHLAVGSAKAFFSESMADLVNLQKNALSASDMTSWEKDIEVSDKVINKEFEKAEELLDLKGELSAVIEELGDVIEETPEEREWQERNFEYYHNIIDDSGIEDIEITETNIRNGQVFENKINTSIQGNANIAPSEYIARDVENTSERSEVSLSSPDMVRFAKDVLGSENIIIKEDLGQGASGFAVSGKQIQLRADVAIGRRFDRISNQNFNKLYKNKDHYEMVQYENFLQKPVDKFNDVEATGLKFVYRKGFATTYIIDPNHKNEVLAHEVGHIVDFVDDKQKRGGILSKLNGVGKFLKHTMNLNPDLADTIDSKEKAKIKRDIYKELKEDDNISSDDLREAVNAQAQKVFADIAKERGIVTKQVITDELKNLTRKWNPFNEGSDLKYTEYRFRNNELYADFISVLLNNPKLAKEIAPNTYQVFMGRLFQKPNVFEAYNEVLNTIATGKTMDKVMKDVHEGYKKADAKYAEIYIKEDTNFRKDVLTNIKSETTYLREAMKEVGHNGSLENNPLISIKNYQYSGGVHEVYVHEIHNQVNSFLTDNNITWDMFADYLLHNRISEERNEMFNPYGLTKEFAEKWLNDLPASSKNVLKEAHNRFNTIRNEVVIAKIKEMDIYDAELIQHLEDNKNYATFDVEAYIDSKHGKGVSSGIHEQVGTVKGIANAGTATLMKDMQLIRSAYMNKARKDLVRTLKDILPEGSVVESEKAFSGKSQTFIETKEKGKKTIQYLYLGQKFSFDIPAEFAIGFIYESRVNFNWLGNIFRTLFISGKPGYMAFNFIRDFFRTLVNVTDGVAGSPVQLAKFYAKAFSMAWKSVGGKGKIPQTVKDMFMNGELISIADRGHLSNLDSEMERITQSWGLTSKALDNLPSWKKPFVHMMIFGDKVNSTVERVGKIAGHLYLQSKGIEGAELADTVRNKVSSPDFLERGKWTGATNNLFLFSNAMIQGWSGDLSTMRDSKQAITRRIIYSGTPKLLMYGLSTGALLAMAKAGDDDENSEFVNWVEDLTDMMKGIKDYDMANYICIPLGKDGSGKVDYLRIPQDETSKFFGGIAGNIFGGAKLSEILNYSGGQIPNLNPIFEMLMATGSIMTGNNHKDLFTGQDVIDRTAYMNATDSRVAPTVIADWSKWIAQKAGLRPYIPFSIMGKNEYQKQEPKSTDALGKFIDAANETMIISDILGRFLKTSDRGYESKIRKDVLTPMKEEKALQSFLSGKIVDKLVDGVKLSELTDEEKTVFKANSKSIRTRYNNKMKKQGGVKDRVFNQGSRKEKKALYKYYRDNK